MECVKRIQRDSLLQGKDGAGSHPGRTRNGKGRIDTWRGSRKSLVRGIP